MSVDKAISKKIMISVAPNGGRLLKTDHPGIPLGATDLARTAAQALEHGASMIHVHVRDKVGAHLLDAAAFADVTDAIVRECSGKVLVQITTEALGQYTVAEQASVLKQVRPAAASLALREFVPNPKHEHSFADLMLWVKAHEVLPQIILYSPEDAAYLEDLMSRGIIPFDDIPVLFVLGRYTEGQTSQPTDILPFLTPKQPKFSHWATCAFGQNEASCVLASAMLGGHVRVGFENNRHLPNGAIAKTNADLIDAVAAPLRLIGGQFASADQLVAEWRALLGG